MSKRNIQQILAGDYWVHWTYTQEEWRNYAGSSWARSRKVIPIGFGCVVLLIVACFLLLLPVLPGVLTPSFAPAFFITMASMAGFFIVIGLIAYIFSYRSYRKRLHQTQSYVYISRLGIYRQEGYTSLSGLFDVKLQQGILRFKCETHNLRGERSASEIEVPVPHGCEREAEQLLKQLHEWHPLR